MHTYVITWLDCLREILRRTEGDVHLGPIAQQQTIDLSAWIQQITVNDSVGHRRLVHGRRIEHRNGRTVIRRSVLCGRQRRTYKTCHEDAGKKDVKSFGSHWSPVGHAYGSVAICILKEILSGHQGRKRQILWE